MAEQTREWSDMVVRQVTEEHGLRKEHVLQQCDLLKRLNEEAQQEQLKDLEARQDRSVKGTGVGGAMWLLGLHRSGPRA